MYYYFFITSLENRQGEMKPTLRALPNQFFPDGTPVDTSLNVRAPKEKGSSSGGNRLDYPEGTYFCSTYLHEITTSNGVRFYTVYRENETSDPDFHPVSDNPGFAYVSPSHRSDEMNAAFINFTTFGVQGEAEENENTMPMKNNTSGGSVRFSPADNSGKARPRIEGWTPSYEDQVKTEAELLASWMRKVLNDLGVRTMARRPKVDTISLPVIEELFASGESVDTIASRARFNHIFVEERMDLAGLSTLNDGPFVWYLTQLVIEHRKGSECTAMERNLDAGPDVDEAAYIIGTEVNLQLGTNDQVNSPEVIADLTAALKKGWTVDDILDPQVLLSQGSIQTLASALASGLIPLPERAAAAGGTTLLDTLMAVPANKRPRAKDGFEVDELTWKVLLVNLATKKNTLLVGPTGSGKTQVIKRLCDQTGTPFTIIPMGSITDPTEQLVGKMDLTPLPNGNVETKYDWADFALAIQRPGVVLLDEINRVPRNGTNILFSCLDKNVRQLPAYGAKGTDKRMIDVHPDCVFFATANLGYAGTEELDEALKNRFPAPIEMDYLDTKSEAAVLSAVTGISKEDATNIATVATDIRKSAKKNLLEHSVSTRETIQCAEYVKYGFSVLEALEITFLPNFEGGETDKDVNCERGTVRAKIMSLVKNN